jgi:hypothetical protein
VPLLAGVKSPTYLLQPYQLLGLIWAVPVNLPYSKSPTGGKELYLKSYLLIVRTSF